MTRAYLSLGSNMGDRAEHLREGVRLMTRGVTHRVSRVYETEPVGGVAQDVFWNLVVELVTSEIPTQLLARAQGAEAARGRVRGVRWGPRTLDVDVLYVEGVTSDDPVLTLPHPRLYDRAFVLAPLRELAPDLVSEAQLAAGAGRVRVLGTLESLA
ncbi:MAG TPA: 2-amino-4-hydroxy-6-hydroxymethyldihydropteridine diphosphokinase [Acidimicrobiales bacterium]|nr:2-amino-4-hydroxy-6-hydroxymethyldihydropteridine diphosphokinase [Acidimicrobiales bacterium]